MPRRLGESAVAASAHDPRSAACGVSAARDSPALTAVRRTLLLRAPRSPYLATAGVIMIRQHAPVAICGLRERRRCEAHRRGRGEKSERRFPDHGLPSLLCFLSP